MKKVFAVLVSILFFAGSVSGKGKPDPKYFNKRTFVGKLGMVTIAMQTDKMAKKVDWSTEWVSKVIVFHVGKTRYRFQASYMSYWEPVLIEMSRIDSIGDKVSWRIFTDSSRIMDIQYSRDSFSVSDDGRCITKKGEDGCYTKPLLTSDKVLLHRVKKSVPAYQRECLEFISRRYGYKL